ncbi:hypothetical protein GBAR_LOCUS9292, partial [Geodia barretti]
MARCAELVNGAGCETAEVPVSSHSPAVASSHTARSRLSVLFWKGSFGQVVKGYDTEAATSCSKTTSVSSLSSSPTISTNSSATPTSAASLSTSLGGLPSSCARRFYSSLASSTATSLPSSPGSLTTLVSSCCTSFTALFAVYLALPTFPLLLHLYLEYVSVH